MCTVCLISVLQDSYVAVPWILYLAFFACFIPVLLAVNLTFVYLGIKTLVYTYRRSTRGQSLVMIQRLTVLMFGTTLGFLGIIITVFIRAKYLIVNQELPFETALGLDISWDLLCAMTATSVEASFLMHRITKLFPRKLSKPPGQEMESNSLGQLRPGTQAQTEPESDRRLSEEGSKEEEKRKEEVV